MQINVMSSEVICNVCPGLCENMQLTKKAAADRKHHLNHAYPPLTAKTEPLLEPFCSKDLDHSLHSQMLLWDLPLDLCKVLLLFFPL